MTEPDCAFIEDEEATCSRCDGSGTVNMCWDDMCAGQDDCLHGDGIQTCMACGGSGLSRAAPLSTGGKA